MKDALKNAGWYLILLVPALLTLVVFLALLLRLLQEAFSDPTWHKFGFLLFFVGIAVVIGIFLVRRFIPRGQSPMGDPGESVLYWLESDTYCYPLTGRAQSRLLITFGLISVAVAYGVWSVNLAPPRVMTAAGRGVTWGLVVLFATLGYLAFACRASVWIDLPRKTVTRVRRIWLLLPIRFKRSWEFSQFDAVEVKVVPIRTRYGTSYGGTISLVRKGGGKPLMVISSPLYTLDIPPQISAQAKHLADRVGLPVRGT